MRILLALPVLWMAACVPEIGEPDRALAGQIVFEARTGNLGVPMTAGQALLYQSCSDASFCHTAGATGEARGGAPGGLDFDVAIACFPGQPGCDCIDEDDCPSADARLATLYESQTRTHDFRNEIWRTVKDGSMPPEGSVQGETEYYFGLQPDTFGTLLDDYVDPMPGIETAEGREILRNWLASGSPVVERALEPPDATTRAGTYCGDETIDVFQPVDCIYRAGAVDPPDPNWNSIFEKVIEPLCLACHLGNGNDNFGPDAELQELDLCGDPTVADGDRPSDLDCDPAAVLMALVNQPAEQREFVGCPSTVADRMLIVPNQPDMSAFFLKLGSEPDCGRPMPQNASDSGLPAEVLEPIREWIMNGAMPGG